MDIKTILTTIIGAYTPDVTSGVDGLASIDWVWILSAVIFAILISSLLKSFADLFKDLFGGW